MEGAAEVSTAVRCIFAAINNHSSVSDSLLDYTRLLEKEYAPSQDIVLFIFGFRSFFCWHRAEELLDSPADIKLVELAWLKQNDDAYTEWLSSPDDNAEMLKWEKWTFQSKTSIFNEFLQAARRGKVGPEAEPNFTPK
jgi:hypothetical protein